MKNVREIRQLLRENGLKSSGSKKQILKRAKDAGLIRKQEPKKAAPAPSTAKKSKNRARRRRTQPKRQEKAKEAEQADVLPEPSAESNVTFQSTWKEFGGHQIFHDFEQKRAAMLAGRVVEISEEEVAGLKHGHDLLGSCKIGDVRHVIHLAKVSGISLDYRDHMGRTGLHWGAWEGRIDTVECLIQLNANLDLPDKMGLRPIHFAAQGGYLNIVNVLIRGGAKIHLQDFHKNTALQYAAYWNYCDIVEQLVIYGCCVTDKGKTFSSVTHYAQTNHGLRKSVESGLSKCKSLVRRELMNFDRYNARLPEDIVDLLLELIFLV